MVSASIPPTKGAAAVPPDQLQALPIKASGRIPLEQLAMLAAVGKTNS